MATFDENMMEADRSLIEKIISDHLQGLSEEELCDVYHRLIGEEIIFDDKRNIFLGASEGD